MLIFLNLSSQAGYIQQKRIFQSPAQREMVRLLAFWKPHQKKRYNLFNTQHSICTQAPNLSVFGMITIHTPSIIPDAPQFRGLLLYLLLRMNYYIQARKGQLLLNVQWEWGYRDLNERNTFPQPPCSHLDISAPPLYQLQRYMVLPVVNLLSRL